MSDQTIWKLNSGDWLQDDAQKSFQILQRDTRTSHAHQQGLDIITGASWHAKTESGCGGFFPSEFKYCTYCGKELATSTHKNEIWVPPCGGGCGLRIVSEQINVSSIPIKQENTIRWLEPAKETLLFPRPRGDYEFIVAPLGTKSPVLVAFDRSIGLLDYFSPAGFGGKNWISLKPTGRIAESKLPYWSWSAALVPGRTGFAVPTIDGPVWIDIDWITGTFTTKLGTGDCVGGAAALDSQLFIPVRTMENLVAIKCFDFAAGEWKQVGEPAHYVMGNSSNTQYFSIPIVDEGRRIVHWVGITGLLTFDLLNQNMLWRSWEKDSHPCRAVPELGPPYRDPFGNFWQLCYDDYDDSQQQRAFRYYKLGGDESDREDVDGGRFSSGISCFSKLYDLWEKPWTKIDKRQDQAKTIRSPLLCLNEESKISIVAHFGSGSILPLIEIVQDCDKKYNTTLRIESPLDLPIELRMPHSFNIHTPWDVRLFIYRDALYVHSPDEALCYKWRLK